jgi:hypothetical protein
LFREFVRRAVVVDSGIVGRPDEGMTPESGSERLRNVLPRAEQGAGRLGPIRPACGGGAARAGAARRAASRDASRAAGGGALSCSAAGAGAEHGRVGGAGRRVTEPVLASMSFGGSSTTARRGAPASLPRRRGFDRAALVGRQGADRRLPLERHRACPDTAIPAASDR